MKEELLIADGPEAVELLKQLKKDEAAQKAAEKKARDEAERASYEKRVQAVLETAWAYYRRGPAIQYDSMDLVKVSSRFDNRGCRRHRDYMSPEDCTLDMPAYTVCSTFPFNVYYEAIGLEITGHVDSANCVGMMNLTDHSIVYHFKENYGETIEEAVEILKAVLRPGDIFASTKGTHHALLYMGDVYGDGVPYFMHSWGAKYNMNTGKDSYETMGTLRLQTMEEVCLRHGQNEWYRENKIPRWCVWGGMSHWAVVRPLRIYKEEEYPLTANALARLEKPGLNIDRRCSETFFRGIGKGEYLTYTLTVENTSQNTYDIPVTEQLPEGTILVEGKLAASWTLAPGEKQTLTYTVRVLPGTKQVVSTGGSVAGIRSNTITVPVIRHLSAEQEQLLQQLPTSEKGGMDFVSRVYEEKLGMYLPEFSVSRFFTAEEDGFVSRNGKKIPMQVERYIGGRLLWYENDRIIEFSDNYLRTGDVLLYITAPLTEEQQEEAYIYLGNGQFADYKGICEESPLWTAFTKDLFICLRPGQI